MLWVKDGAEAVMKYFMVPSHCAYQQPPQPRAAPLIGEDIVDAVPEAQSSNVTMAYEPFDSLPDLTPVELRHEL